MITIYIFMYVNVLIENTYEVRVMFDSIRIDSQVTHLATAHMECAAWVHIPIPTAGQSQVGYITVTDSK